jgi:NAD-dependent deacetylase
MEGAFHRSLPTPYRSAAIFSVLLSVLDKYRQVVFWVGAGLSQASGVCGPPRHDRRSFLEGPDQVWSDYLQWREHILSCSPNAGHHLLHRLQSGHPMAHIVTLNQDGLLQRAGCQVLELHGTVWGSRCFQCDQPGCTCQARQRPDVIWSGEDLPARPLQQALEWLRQCDCLVSLGTSGRQPPASHFPLETQGAYRIEINPQETALSPYYDECWRGPAEVLLARLIPNGSRADRSAEP